MNGYLAYYKGQELEVHAQTLYEAQRKAVEHFKARKSYDVIVALCEKPLGVPYVHVAVN